MASSSLAFARLSAPSFYFRVSIPWCPQRREWLSGAASSLYHLSCQASTKTQCPQQWRPRAEPSHWWETYRSCSRVMLKKWPRHDVTSGLSPASAVHPFQEQLTESEQHSNTTTSWPSQWKVTSVSHITFISCIYIYICMCIYIYMCMYISYIIKHQQCSNGCTMITMVHPIPIPIQPSQETKARQRG